MYVERWTGGLVKPHTFFKFDDERIDGGTADKTTSFTISSTLVLFGVIAAIIFRIILTNDKFFVLSFYSNSISSL